MRRRVGSGVAAIVIVVLSAMAPQLARAQDWPNKPIKMIVPFPAGGGTDFIARLLAQQLTARLGKNVYVENRGGANGAIGLQALKQADPDGYTVAVSSDSPIVVNPNLQPGLSYRPLEDFVPVASLARFPSMIVAHPSSNIRTIADLIAAAKKDPGQLSYSSAGVGNFSHLAMELFARRAGIKLLHVPYRGAGPAAAGLIAGDVQLGVANVQVVMQNVQAGLLLPLGVGEQERISALPDVPTISETLPGFTITPWAGLLVPARTPGEIVQRLGNETSVVLKDKKVRELLEQQQVTPFFLEQSAFADLVKSDLDRWRTFLKETDIQLK
jgi:tripartite-type tricarboxylate transporter receptor subunit TctC